MLPPNRQAFREELKRRCNPPKRWEPIPPQEQTMRDRWARQRAAERKLPPAAPGEALTLPERPFVLPPREIRSFDDALEQASVLTQSRNARVTLRIAEVMYGASRGARETSSF